MDKKQFIKKYGCDENWGVLLKDGRLINGMFTCLRVDEDDVPEGMFKYDIRESDDLSLPAAIEKHVFVNHYGTFVTDTEIDFGGCDSLEIDNSDVEETDDEDCENEIEMWPYGYDDDSLKGYEVVTWPESQDLMERDGFFCNAYLINDDEGLDMYGSSAYVVDKYWLDSL